MQLLHIAASAEAASVLEGLPKRAGFVNETVNETVPTFLWWWTEAYCVPQ